MDLHWRYPDPPSLLTQALIRLDMREALRTTSTLHGGGCVDTVVMYLTNHRVVSQPCSTLLATGPSLTLILGRDLIFRASQWLQQPLPQIDQSCVERNS